MEALIFLSVDSDKENYKRPYLRYIHFIISILFNCQGACEYRKSAQIGFPSEKLLTRHAGTSHYTSLLPITRNRVYPQASPIFQNLPYYTP